MKRSNLISNTYLFAFFADFVFIYPFYNLMFKDNGIGAFKMSVLLIACQISKMIADIPSGFLADKYGRKMVFAFGQIFRFSFISLLIIDKSFTSFLIAMMLYGFSMSCIFGNLEAYCYDGLKLEGRKEYFSIFISRVYIFQNISITLASFLSGYIFNFGGYDYILFFSLIFIAISLIFILRLPSYHFCDLSKKSVQKFSVLNAIKIFIQNKQIKFYSLIAVINDACFLFFIDLNTTMMAHKEFTASRISSLISLMGFARIISHLIAGYTVKNFTSQVIVSIMMLFFIFINYFSTVYFVNVIYLVMLYLVFYAFLDVSIKTKLQIHVTSESRATVMSVISFFVSIFAVCLNLINGSLVHYFNIEMSVKVLSLILILSTFLVYVLCYKNRRNNV